MKSLILAAVTTSCLLLDQAFAGIFFNDIRPRDYKQNRVLDIHVGKLISPIKMSNAVDFYHLNYCLSTGTHHYDPNAESIDVASPVEGVTMYDQDLHESFFQYKVGQNKINANPCSRNLTDQQISDFKEAILYRYKFRLYVDGLPSAVLIRDPETGAVHKDFDSGVPVGKLINTGDVENMRYVLYNHWNIVVKTSPVPESKNHRIVGFEVEPRSYAQGETVNLQFKQHKVLYLDDLLKMDAEKRNFEFTYSI